MDALATMLQAVAHDPGDDTAWLALADCLGEAGEERRAELLRVQLALRQPEVPDAPRLERRLLELWALGVPPCQPLLTARPGLEFVLIPPGSFWMGAEEGERWADPDELPRRRVTLKRGFYLGVTPITPNQWGGLMPRFPPGPYSSPNEPIVCVSWGDAEDFCWHLGARLGRRCRLPTEAEWEYACRAGTSGMYCCGDDVEALGKVGWCSYDGKWDSAGGTLPVRQLGANSWGLFDMHGNVWEWCSDWYARDAYEHAPSIDPRGPGDGAEAVVRGGSYRGGPWFCRSAERRGVDPASREVNIGFRVVAEL
jgi:uncharacterized protein (TIGR02996 family)